MNRHITKNKVGVVTHGMSNSPEYVAWKGMRNRCYYRGHNRYENYSGRGIRVCMRWKESFENFYADMGPKPGAEFSIERMDNDDDYTPDNCCWATPKEQSRNTRRNRMVTHNDETRCLSEWAEIVGIRPNTIWHRINTYGWSVDRALTTPVRGQ